MPRAARSSWILTGRPRILSGEVALGLGKEGSLKVLVLGAGVIGTTTAWYLARAGHEVTVVDRQPEPAYETSFANGGQVSVCHAMPWANPQAPLKILKWLGRDDAPLLFRPRRDLNEWRWGLRFLFECLPWRTRHNTRSAFALARYSRDCLQALRAETGIEYDQGTRGILSICTEESALAAAGREAAVLRRYGLEVTSVGPEQCLEIEPALSRSRVKIYGGSYAASDETGDAHLFTQRLAALAADIGVTFDLQVTVEAVETERGRVERVVARDPVGAPREYRADAYVAALGSYTPRLLAPLGLDIPVYPVKGYSVTFDLGERYNAPSVSVTDQERKIVFTRLGNRLRVAGTAELNGYNTELARPRIEALIERTYALFPPVSRPTEPRPWAGLRPATPSNLPLIGGTRYANLYLNTGHGTLGWTMACGSGRALLDLMEGRRPEPNFPFVRPARASARAAEPLRLRSAS